MLRRFAQRGSLAAVFVLLVVAGCGKAPPQPLIMGGEGKATIDRGIEKRNATGTVVPPPVDMQELPPPSP